jgi:endonuclease G, mitochondrial
MPKRLRSFVGGTSWFRKAVAWVAVGFLMAPGLALSYGLEGHETVALIAQSRLSGKVIDKIKAIKNAKFDVKDVLSDEKPPFDFIDKNLVKFINDSSVNLANVALWPDGFKFKPGMEASKEWHFIDLPITKDITEKDFPEYCKDRNCVVDQIYDQLAILKDDSSDPAKRFEALCYVVHFCGDIHQPLHCADDNDRGGNNKKVLYMNIKKPVNLHSVWDTKIIQTYMRENGEKTNQDFANDIIKNDIPKDTSDWTNSRPEDWAMESYDLAKNKIYPAYYDAGPGTPKLGQDYVDEMSPVIKDQLAKGGVRLAYLLEQALGNPPMKSAPSMGNLPADNMPDSGDLDNPSLAASSPVDTGINGQWGLPSDENLIDKGTYVISYNNDYKIPNWVCYHLSKSDLDHTLKRNGQWKVEKDVAPEYQATSADYSKSGYDKGHLCPSADMVRSLKAMQATFVYSNCAPQVGAGFNRAIWMYLETQVRKWAQDKGEVWIYTGVFFDKDGEPKTIGPHHVGIPPHWYKIVFSPPNSLVAFQFDNKAYKGRDFKAEEIPVKTIEQETGLSFLDKLDKKTRDKIEAQKESGDWN